MSSQRANEGNNSTSGVLGFPRYLVRLRQDLVVCNLAGRYAYILGPHSFPFHQGVLMSRSLRSAALGLALLLGARAATAQTLPVDDPILRAIWTQGMDSSRAS